MTTLESIQAYRIFTGGRNQPSSMPALGIISLVQGSVEGLTTNLQAKGHLYVLTFADCQG